MRNFINIVENWYGDSPNHDWEIPNVWYHGTEADPEEAARDFLNHNLNTVGGNLGGDIWFSDSEEACRYYGHNVVRATIKFKNPKLVSQYEFQNEGRRTTKGPMTWAEEAKREGHDAVIIHDIMDGDMFSTVCAVFDIDIIEAVPHSRYDEDTDRTIYY